MSGEGAAAARWHGRGKASGVPTDVRQFDVYELRDHEVIRATLGCRSQEEARKAAAIEEQAMSAEANVEIARRFTETMARGDYETAAAMLAPDFTVDDTDIPESTGADSFYEWIGRRAREASEARPVPLLLFVHPDSLDREGCRACFRGAAEARVARRPLYLRAVLPGEVLDATLLVTPAPARPRRASRCGP